MNNITNSILENTNQISVFPEAVPYPPGFEMFNTLKKRLYSKLIPNNENGCLEWVGGHDKKGYGRIRGTSGQNFRVLLTHRASWICHFGEIPKGLNILHLCDNPKCCNPNHLFLGTQKDNMQDASRKNRTAYGEKNKKSVLVVAQVKQIRNLCKDLKQKDLAKQFGISQQEVSRIVQNKRWTHV